MLRKCGCSGCYYNRIDEFLYYFKVKLTEDNDLINLQFNKGELRYLYDLLEYCNWSVSHDRIREKIGELENKIKDLDIDLHTVNYVKPEFEYKIQVLKELLEEDYE